MLNNPNFCARSCNIDSALAPGTGEVPRDFQPIVSRPHLSHNLNPSV